MLTWEVTCLATARGRLARALRSHLLAAICTNADRRARAPLPARRRPQRRTRSMHHAGPSGKPPTQLTNTETRDRKRWSRSKFGQPAAIYTRAAVEYRGLCVQRRSDTPLRYAVVPDQNDGNTRREQQQCANKHHGGGVEGKWNDPNRPFSIRDRAPGEP